MFVDIVTNATRMPTDGFGASAAERENGNATAILDNSVTCSGGAAAAVAGDLILLGTGFWAEVTGPAVAGVLPVKEWKKWGVQPQHTNTGVLHAIPTANSTYRIFPASILQNYRYGWRVKSAQIQGVAGATLTINGPTNAVVIRIPCGLASLENFMVPPEDALVQGPFTLVCSNHAVVGQIEFSPVSA